MVTGTLKLKENNFKTPASFCFFKLSEDHYIFLLSILVITQFPLSLCCKMTYVVLLGNDALHWQVQICNFQAAYTTILRFAVKRRIWFMPLIKRKGHGLMGFLHMVNQISNKFSVIKKDNDPVETIIFFTRGRPHYKQRLHICQIFYIFV